MIEFFPSRTVAVIIGNFPVHWYGLLYFAAFIIAWFLLPRLQKYRNLSLSADEWSRLISWAVIGVIAGGRLGYVLFYDPLYYLSNPLEIFAVWKGGMASHGGFIGVTFTMLWATRDRKNDRRSISDVVIVPVAIGLALGRLGNFINQELYGTITSFPWGMEFPGAEGLRHPVQIYAMMKDLFIAAMCFVHLRSRPFIAGRTFALFLMLYGVLRFLTEFVREQNGEIYAGLSEGQWLTIPVFIVGVILWLRAKK
jgi:phosphatidylglycerol---prolipoprotein diacylglyceryl transferase